MKKVEVKINNVAYPCRPTMGAMLRFKRETGREVTDISEDAITDLCTFLWCCVVSASKADNVNFDMPLMDFADSIALDDLMAWAETINGGKGNSIEGTDAPGEEKKSQA